MYWRHNSVMSILDWYLPLKALHISVVLLSGSLFALRGWAVLRGQAWGMARPLRLATYAIDTVLLGAGVAMWAALGLNPLRETWLGAKLLLLLLYIVLGSLALKRARSPRARLAAYVAALLTFAYMLSVARAHHPLGIFALLAG